jgi:hypothetical protein
MKYLRRKIFTILIALSTSAMADDHGYLNFSQVDGESSFHVGEISKMTFDDTNLIILTTDGSEQRLPLSGLQKMYFSENASQGIGTTETAANKISFGDGQLRLQLAEGEKATIYNMRGEQIFTANRSMTIDTGNLRQGVYIVRVGTIVKKFMSR